MRIKKSLGDKVLQGIAALIVIGLALLCVIPFYLIVVASFSSEQDIIVNGFSVIPRTVVLDAYRLVFRVPEVVFRAYGVSLFVTIVGTGIGLFATTMTAYVLLRKKCKYRNQIAFFVYFTSLFSGGMIPSYILITEYLHLKDSMFAMILPLLLSSWNILLMRNFMKEIPEEMAEAASIDGANEFTIFMKLYLPLSGAGLATIGLFIALMYWNDWYHAMLYINSSNKQPLQYLLYNMLNNIEGMRRAAAVSNIPVGDLPAESFKMAMAVVTTGPIILLYPFVQKYFVKGLTMGAVKG